MKKHMKKMYNLKKRSASIFLKKTVKIRISSRGANLVFGPGGGALIGDGALIFFF